MHSGKTSRVDMKLGLDGESAPPSPATLVLLGLLADLISLLNHDSVIYPLIDTGWVAKSLIEWLVCCTFYTGRKMENKVVVHNHLFIMFYCVLCQ